MNPTQSQPTALPKHTPTPLSVQHPNLRPTELEALAFISETLRNADPKTTPARHLGAMCHGLSGFIALDEHRASHPALVAENKRLRKALLAVSFGAVIPASYRTQHNADKLAPLLDDIKKIARAALAKEDV